MKYLDLHGDRVAYREAGAGEALLLIHGMAGSSATWRAVLPQLPKKYRVVAPDLFGQGPKRNIRTWLETKLDMLKEAYPGVTKRAGRHEFPRKTLDHNSGGVGLGWDGRGSLRMTSSSASSSNSVIASTK